MRHIAIPTTLVCICLLGIHQAWAWPGQDEPSSALPPDTQLNGASSNGQDGCYFNECPDGNPTPPGSNEPVNNEPSDVPNAPNPVPIDTSQRATHICQTQVLWCRMGVSGPPGYPCYCNTPMGFYQGVTVPEQ